jgi:hypothetical protein
MEQPKVWNAWLLKTGPTGFPETSVTNYQLTLHNIPEERRLNLHCGGSLKSRNSVPTPKLSEFSFDGLRYCVM